MRAGGAATVNRRVRPSPLRDRFGSCGGSCCAAGSPQNRGKPRRLRCCGWEGGKVKPAIVGVKLFVIRASSEGEVYAAFATIVQKLIGALLVGSDSFFFMRRDQLAALSARDGVVTMYFFREFVEAGGLISYGTRLPEGFKTVGAYTGKILSGAKPADLPIIQQSEKIELIVNLKAANALGLTVPQVLLVQADEVIE
jgi:putative tryptophan/tyrosine transport system substrate-binding protein